MRCDFATWRPITANYTTSGMGDIRGVVVHVEVGNGSLHDFFSNPATEASAHFWCSKTGALEQYVDTANKAWAEAAGNPYFISVETEGQVDEPLTSAQLDTVGRLIAWVHSHVAQFPLVVNEDPNGSGVTPHRCGGVAWGGHSCPGDLRFSQYPELVQAALRWLDTQPPPTPIPAPTPTEEEPMVVWWTSNGNTPEHCYLVFPNRTLLALSSVAVGQAHAAAGIPFVGVSQDDVTRLGG